MMPSYREQLIHQLQCQGAFTEQGAIELVDVYTVQVLGADGQAYPGELTTLRTLVRKLRVAARNCELSEVQALLTEAARDDGAAREVARS